MGAGRNKQPVNKLKTKKREKAVEKIGKIGKVFGPAGELNLNLYDTFPETFDTEEPLWVMIDSLAVPLFIERFARRGQSGATVLFSDIDTPARAGQLYGLELLDGNPMPAQAGGAAGRAGLAAGKEGLVFGEDELVSGEGCAGLPVEELDDEVYLEDLVGFRVVITEQLEQDGLQEEVADERKNGHENGHEDGRENISENSLENGLENGRENSRENGRENRDKTAHTKRMHCNTDAHRDTVKTREGEITAFIDNDMNPLLAIMSDGVEILLPAADEYIDLIDVQSRTIYVTTPPGLLELFIEA